MGFVVVVVAVMTRVGDELVALFLLLLQFLGGLVKCAGVHQGLFQAVALLGELLFGVLIMRVMGGFVLAYVGVVLHEFGIIV